MRRGRTSHRWSWPWLGILLAGLCACGDDTAPPGPVQVSTLSVQPVQWTAGQPPLGHVMAVADVADQVVVFSDGGAFMFSGGSQTGSDNSVVAWRGAAAVPALGLPGTWVLGVDGTGRLFRTRGGTTLVEVTQSYGLQGKPVGAVVPLGGGGPYVAFAVGQQLAVTDGKSLSIYDLPPRGLTGGGGRLAVVDDAGVQVLTPASGALQRLSLDGVTGAAFDLDGHLVVATAQALYEESGQDLVQVYDAGTDSIKGLAGSGSGTWVAVGDSLALLGSGQLQRGPAGQVPAGAQLTGSPSGDVWLTAGGKLTRMGLAGGTGADETQWRQTMLPIFNRVCRGCHLPGGIANLDLSTYPSWAMSRSLIGQVVLTGKPVAMPPAGTGTLTTVQLAAVQTWVSSKPGP